MQLIIPQWAASLLRLAARLRRGRRVWLERGPDGLYRVL